MHSTSHVFSFPFLHIIKLAEQHKCFNIKACQVLIMHFDVNMIRWPNIFIPSVHSHIGCNVVVLWQIAPESIMFHSHCKLREVCIHVVGCWEYRVAYWNWLKFELVLPHPLSGFVQVLVMGSCHFQLTRAAYVLSLWFTVNHLGNGSVLHTVLKKPP